MDPSLTIVLLGHSGVGKSASGNTILGRPAFESRKAFTSVTKQIDEQTGSVFGKHISVIDTPTILDSEQEIRTKCEEVMCSFRRKLFLVVVKVDRFTEEQKNSVEAAIRTVEDDGMKNCFMLFTHGDSLNSMSMSLDDFLNEDPDSPLPGLVQQFAGTHVFNNDNGGQEQVKELLEKSDRLPNIVRPRGNTDERRIVLLGLPGGGKSSAGNTILGSLDQFKSDCSFDPVTTETVSKSSKVGSRWVTVVDTPGFTAKGLTPEKLYDEIKKAIVEACLGPHAFVIVVRIGRISEAENKVFKILRKLFCRDAAKQTVVLFTHGDQLKGRSIKDFIQGNTDVPQANTDVPQANTDVPQANTDVPQANTDVPQGNKDVSQANSCVSKLINMCGDRYCVFDNTKRGNRQQVKDLLSKIDEMIRTNTRAPYTPERFYKVQTIPVKMSIEWEWFKRKLREIDVIQSGNNQYTYTKLDSTV